MKFNTKAMLSLALVATFVLVGGDAFAQAVRPATLPVDGAKAPIAAIFGAMEGYLGLLLGVGLALLGLYTWIIKQETAAGIMFIIGGVLFTVFPNVFDAIQQTATPIFKQFGTARGTPGSDF